MSYTDDELQMVTEILDGATQAEADGQAVPGESVAQAEKAIEEKTAATEEPPAGISANDVAGTKKDEVVAPDATMLRDKLASLAAPQKAPEADPQQLQYQALQVQLQQLQQALLPQKEQPQEDPVRAAYERAEAAQQQIEELRAQIEERQRQDEYEALRGGVKAFVHSKKDKFPVIAGSGNEDLVFEQMYQSLQAGNPMSESEAAAHVEGELRSFIDKYAGVLGWTKPGESSQSSANSKSEPSTTLNPQTVPSSPVKSWGEMTQAEQEAEALKLLL